MKTDRIGINLARKLFSLEMDKKDVKKFFYNIPRGKLYDKFKIYKMYEQKINELLKKQIKGEEANRIMEKFHDNFYFKNVPLDHIDCYKTNSER